MGNKKCMDYVDYMEFVGCNLIISSASRDSER